MINSDIQKLEPGERVRLYELDCSAIGGTVERYHSYPIGEIVFQGLSYFPWPIETQNIERTGEVQQPSPTLRVSNIGVDSSTGEQVSGVITALCLALQDLVGAKLTIRETFAKYLDGEPEADPTQELPRSIWFIEQRIDEAPDWVSFELAGALTLDGLQLPSRQIQAGSCVWLYKGGYRGPYCQYTGNAYFTDQDIPTSDPARDKCGGRVESCQKRFAAQQGVQPIEAVINIGAFPSSDRLR